MSMKIHSVPARAALLSSAALGFLLFLSPLSAQALEVYGVDSVHSTVNFKVRHLFNNVGGRFDQFDGTLWYDAQNPQSSRIELTIQAASIDTDNEKRDNHLRSADFFDVEKYPLITFKSTKIEPAGQDDLYRVTGDFSMHGVTKPVVIDVELLGFGEIPGLGHRGGFEAETTINRKDYGIVWNQTLDSGGLLLGDDVQVQIGLQVARNGQ